MKKIKIIKSLLTSLTLVAPLVANACTVAIDDEGFDYSNNWKSDRSNLVFYFNGASTYTPYDLDLSRSYGGFNENIYYINATSLPLIRNITFDENVYKPSSNGLELVGGELAKSYFKLEAAESIILTVDDNGVEKTLTFNEDVDLNQRVPVKTPNSINGTEFLDALQISTKIQFKVRSSIPWVDNKGQATPYFLTAQDYYVSYMRSILTDPAKRYAAGGSKTLDTHRSNNSGLTFKLGSGYHNDYLFELYEVLNPEKFVEEDFLIQKIGNTNDVGVTFSFNPSSSWKYDFMEFMANNTLFLAAPSQYIQSQEFRNKHIEEIDGPKNSEVDKLGIYQYGRTLSTLLFAGTHYITENRSDLLSISLNTKYWDEKYLNRGTAVKTFKAVWSPVDKLTFLGQSFNQFKLGMNFAVRDIGSLPSENQKAIRRNPEKYGLRDSIKYNSTQSSSNIAWNPFANPVEGIKADFFNEAFAELMWGWTERNPNSGSIGNYYLPNASSFRSSISAAINWYAIENSYFKNTWQNWGNFYAPNIIMSSANRSQLIDIKESGLDSEYKLSEFSKTSSWYVDSTGNLSDSNFTRPRGEEYKQSYINSSQSVSSASWQSYVSPEYQKIKANVKRILDDKFGNRNVKISFRVPHRFLNITATEVAASLRIIEVINGLDPRMDASFKVIPSGDSALLNSLLTKNIGAFRFLGWTVDYNFSSSFIDGLIQSFGGIFALSGILKTDPTKMSQFNELYKFASALDRKFQNRFGISLKVFGDLTYNSAANGGSDDPVSYMEGANLDALFKKMIVQNPGWNLNPDTDSNLSAWVSINTADVFLNGSESGVSVGDLASWQQGILVQFADYLGRPMDFIRYMVASQSYGQAQLYKKYVKVPSAPFFDLSLSDYEVTNV